MTLLNRSAATAGAALPSGAATSAAPAAATVTPSSAAAVRERVHRVVVPDSCMVVP